MLQIALNTHVTLTMIAALFSTGSLGYMLGAVVTGQLTNRINGRFLLAAGLALLAIGSLLDALAPSAGYLITGQIVLCFGWAAVDIALNLLATLTFRATLTEKMNTIHGMYGLGALCGPLVLAFCLAVYHILYFSYLIGFGVCLITLLLALSLQTPMPEATSATSSTQAHRSANWKVLTSGLLWMLMLQIALYSAAQQGFSQWIVTVVSKASGLLPELAVPVATAFFAGMMCGRLGGAQVLKRGWLSESRLLYMALTIGGICGLVTALFPAQLLIIYPASFLLGLGFGPCFPSFMSILSRLFAENLGPASSVAMLGSSAGAMSIPSLMGLLIPTLGFNGIMIFPALCALAVMLPLTVVIRQQQKNLLRSTGAHTMGESAEMSVSYKDVEQK